MSVIRAGDVDPEGEEYAEPDYDEVDYYDRVGILPPLRVSLVGQTGMVKDANGWVHLIRDGKEQGPPSLCEHAQATVPPGLTLDDVIQAYEKRAAQWKESPHHAELVGFLRRTVLQVRDLKLDSCVCVGIGTFAGEHPYCPGGRSMDQLAAVETVLDVLVQKHNIGSKFVQDPAMNSLDVAFVRSRGFTVLDDPDAQNRLTSNTLLFAPNCEWFVIKGSFEIAYPAVFIGPDLDGYLACVKCEYPANCSGEERDVYEQSLKDEHRKIFERVYKPFCDEWLSADAVMEPNGEIQRAYWKRTAISE